MQIISEKIQCLIFDLDDTLVKLSPLASPYFIWKTCLAYRPYCSTLKVLRGLKNTKKIILQQPFSHPHPHERICHHQRILEAFAAGCELSVAQCLEVQNKSLEPILQSLKGFFSPIAQAQKFISGIKSNIPLVLANNPLWPRFFAEQRLRWGNLNHQDFLWITHAHNMTSCKPHQAYFDELVEKNLTYGIQKEHCLFIGNDAKRDAQAIYSGITTILLKKQSGSRTLKAASNTHAALITCSWNDLHNAFGIPLS